MPSATSGITDPFKLKDNRDWGEDDTPSEISPQFTELTGDTSIPGSKTGHYIPSGPFDNRDIGLRNQAVVAQKSPISTDTSGRPVGGQQAQPQQAQPQPAIPTKPEEKNKANQEPDLTKIYNKPAVAADLNDENLPFAKAAAWNAFFSNILRQPGGQQGGFAAAVAAYGNAYGRSLEKFQEQETEYITTRDRINKGYKDAIATEVTSFNSGDESVNNIVKSLAHDPNKLAQYAQSIKDKNPAQFKQIEGLLARLNILNNNRRDDMLQAAIPGGQVSKSDRTKGVILDANGNYVGPAEERIVTYKNGRQITKYYDQNGNELTKPPAGFMSEEVYKELIKGQTAANVAVIRADAQASKSPPAVVQKRYDSITDSLDVLEAAKIRLAEARPYLGQGSIVSGAKKIIGTISPEGVATGIKKENERLESLQSYITQQFLPRLEALKPVSNTDLALIRENAPKPGATAEQYDRWFADIEKLIHGQVKSFNQANAGKYKQLEISIPTKPENPETPATPQPAGSNAPVGGEKAKIINFYDLPKK